MTTSKAQSSTGAAVGTVFPIASDQYFGGELGLVATFDFEYDRIAAYEKELKWAQFTFIPLAWVGVICCHPCFLNQNVEWATRAQHVALTQDGIRYVSERHPSLCGLSFTDKGKQSKTVPYDKITDCDVQEPAGAACCCCVQRVLSTVNVDTASSGKVGEGGVVRHELQLVGLQHANEFKQAVWGMKRSEGRQGVLSGLASAPAQVQMDNRDLLIEIRDELKVIGAALASRPEVSKEEIKNTSVASKLEV